MTTLFPDPDLLPLEFTQSYVDKLRSELPELPDQKKARFIESLGLRPTMPACGGRAHGERGVLRNRAGGPCDKARDGKLAANWVINELFGRLNKEGRDIAASPVSAAQLAAIVGLIGEGTISARSPKTVRDRLDEGGDPRGAGRRARHGSRSRIWARSKRSSTTSSQPTGQGRAGESQAQLAGWFVGQVMKQSGGRPIRMRWNDLLKAKLGI